MTADDSVYASRFAQHEQSQRQGVWIEICRYLQRCVPEDSVVLDIASDKGLLIGSIKAAERWATDLRDMSGSMPEGVKFVQSNGLELDGVLPPAYFDRIFMSNYLEHLPSGDAVIHQFRVARQLLKPGGQVIVLQPNIRLVGGSYWDFIDHRTALTERSLTEAAVAAGLKPVKTVVRFLPYSTKGRLPRFQLLVRADLAFPLIWRVMGKQTLFIAERTG